MKLDWYRDFFRDVALEFWRDAIPPDQTQRETEFVIGSLALEPGARVLDVPCGAGRLALPLAARGFRVTGVDLSAEAIAEARQAAAARHLDVEWREADMRDLPGESAFDAALCFGNSFGYLDREGTQTFFRAVARALRPGGRFVMDTGMTAESLLPNLRERDEASIAGFRFIEENRYHAASSCLETRYTFIRGGAAHTRTALHWTFTVGEVVAFLTAAGLRVEGLHRSLAGEPFVLGAPLLLVLAVRV
jgi:SAM-dependent methyltransferase